MTPKTYLSNKSIYKRSGVIIACIFGSTIAGAFLASKNLKALKRESEIFKTYCVGVGLVATVAGLSFLIEYLVGREMPSSGVTVVQVMAFSFYYNALVPAEQVDNFHPNTYISNWKAFGVSLIFLIIILSAVALVMLPSLL